jgi:hypothetical protein
MRRLLDKNVDTETDRATFASSAGTGFFAEAEQFAVYDISACPHLGNGCLLHHADAVLHHG